VFCAEYGTGSVFAKATTGQGVLNTFLSQPRRDIGAVRYYRCGTFAAAKVTILRRRRLIFYHNKLDNN